MTPAESVAAVLDQLCRRAHVRPDDASPDAARAVLLVLTADEVRFRSRGWDWWVGATTGLAEAGYKVSVSPARVLLCHPAAAPGAKRPQETVPLPGAVAAAVAARIHGFRPNGKQRKEAA